MNAIGRSRSSKLLVCKLFVPVIVLPSPHSLTTAAHLFDHFAIYFDRPNITPMADFDFPFTSLQSSLLLRIVLEFCRENERIFLSHTSCSNRKAITTWIPNLTEYRTLTRPKVLVEIFLVKNGVYTLGVPRNKRELHFNMSMLANVDIHARGVSVFRWFQIITGLTPVLDTKRVLVTKCLGDQEISLTERQILILKRRLEGGLDKRLMVDDRVHWEFIRNMLENNSSISRFVFSGNRQDIGVNCFADIFVHLSQRSCVTEYLDISGPLSFDTIQSFHHLAWGLTGIMLRRCLSATILSMMNIVISRPNEASLTCLQFESCHLDSNAQEPILSILDTLSVETLVFSKTTLRRLGYSKVLAVIGNSTLKKLFFRKCVLSLTEIVQCLFLPTIPDSCLLQLSLTYMFIPEEAASALMSCLETSSFLTLLSLEGCVLKPNCLRALVSGLKKSSLAKLNLTSTNIGCFAHKLFKNLTIKMNLRTLILDKCTICSRSEKDYRGTMLAYRQRRIQLVVSLKNCNVVLNHDNS